jgi:hypothetical protein
MFAVIYKKIKKRSDEFQLIMMDVVNYKNLGVVIYKKIDFV